jgi:hypothetical protein
MSYENQSSLNADTTFQGRVFAVNTQQADTYKDDGRADMAALAQSILRGDIDQSICLVRMAAAGPGIADKVDTGDGIDQSLVTDEDLLALTQANWPTVAGLYYNADGSPKEVI